MKTKRHKTRGIPAKYGLRKKADSFTCRLTRPDVKSLLHVVLNNTFFTFGTTIYRQTCGIPMGISPAPFMANLFLAAYEFQFRQRVFAATVPNTAVYNQPYCC